MFDRVEVDGLVWWCARGAGDRCYFFHFPFPTSTTPQEPAGHQDCGLIEIPEVISKGRRVAGVR